MSAATRVVMEYPPVRECVACGSVKLACPEHIGYMIATLPAEWLAGFAYREPIVVGEGSDDIPF